MARISKLENPSIRSLADKDFCEMRESIVATSYVVLKGEDMTTMRSRKGRQMSELSNERFVDRTCKLISVQIVAQGWIT